MTTDVINGVPRELLRDAMRMLEAHSPGSGSVESYAAQDIQALLATAQPAADGEREAICCEHSWKVAKDAAWAARSLNKCKCDHNEYCDHCFPPDFRNGGKWHAGYQARAAQPKQAVAVTDEVRRLREALEFYANGDHLLLADPDEWDTCSGEPVNWLHDEAGTASVEDGSVAKAALAAHKTGEEE